jgi:hypothetical protein
VSGNRLHILYTALRTEKAGSYSVGSSIIPKEEDLVSMCLDEDRLWMLANSPILSVVEGKGSLFVLYEGTLGNIDSLLARKELTMTDKYEFKHITNSSGLRFKTILPIEDRIYLVGGLAHHASNNECFREDYVLEKVKDRFRLKMRKL